MKKINFQFPSIYRTITEKHPTCTKLIGVLLLSLFFVIFVIIGLDLLKSVSRRVELEKQKQEIISKINYWKAIVKNYKGYRDGYFQLAILEYRLNDKQTAETYLQDALEIDPNFQKGRELEKILGKQ